MPYSHAYNAALVTPLRDRADHGVPLTDNAGRRFPLVWVRTYDRTTGHDTSASDRRRRPRTHQARLFAELVEPARKRGMRTVLSPRLRDWYLPRFQKSILGEFSLSTSHEVYWDLFGYDKRVGPSLTELGARADARLRVSRDEAQRRERER
jgi:hypothetical protein